VITCRRRSCSDSIFARDQMLSGVSFGPSGSPLRLILFQRLLQGLADPSLAADELEERLDVKRVEDRAQLGFLVDIGVDVDAQDALGIHDGIEHGRPQFRFDPVVRCVDAAADTQLILRPVRSLGPSPGTLRRRTLRHLSCS
jgi:hypothetical protein